MLPRVTLAKDWKRDRFKLSKSFMLSRATDPNSSAICFACRISRWFSSYFNIFDISNCYYYYSWIWVYMIFYCTGYYMLATILMVFSADSMLTRNFSLSTACDSLLTILESSSNHSYASCSSCSPSFAYFISDFELLHSSSNRQRFLLFPIHFIE